MAELTPMMQQYHSIKKRYPDSILFFRMGDFYEMFEEDAKTAARHLDIALTSRKKGGGDKTPMAGVPAHSAEAYIAELIDLDYKVAICEQLEDPEEASGLVERDVIRVITPGTVIENELLEEKENNFLTAVSYYQQRIGFSYIDISTGDFYVTEFAEAAGDKVWDELDRINPRELIIGERFVDDRHYQQLAQQLQFVRNQPENLSYNQAYNKLLDHFKTQSLAGFGCEEMEAAVMAAGQVLTFVEKTQKRALEHVNQLQTYNLREYMMLDSTTRRNLELTRTLRDQKLEGSLLSILDQTVTSMGGRLIKRWLNQPLINKPQIEERLAAVSGLSENYILLQDIRDDLEGIYDLERILGKITYESANARDLAFLRMSLKKLPGLAEDCSQLDNQLFQRLMEEFDELEDLYQILDQALVDDPPVSVREGGLIKEGYNQQLDQLRQNRKEGKDWIANLQQQERERTGINSLKVGFNKIFGYYIEVTNPNLDRVPEDYTRKQTLSNSERYIIPELKEKEAQVLGAEEKINDLEYELFVELRSRIGDNLDRIKQTATVISRIDVLTSLAQVALEKDYICPEIEENQQIDISRSRHPVVEDMLPGEFVPNDCYLDHQEDRFIIITGPNMSGKSTYMRQVALIVLMAQIGSFVPAAEASIGIVDRIFTRVGASDDLTTGQSTFMIEMNEVANIVNNATEDSLIILDEVGRGTSTYDGVSIAWAVSEYISNPDKIGARSLFATHYHELTQLEGELEGIKNYNVLVEEDEEGVSFLYKIAPGRADESYGIEVARLAGLPDDLIERASQILDHLEGDNQLVQKDLLDGQDAVLHDGLHAEGEGHSPRETGDNKGKNRVEQLPLFRQEEPIVQEIRDKDLMGMTPLDALNYLYQLQQQIKGKGEDYG